MRFFCISLARGGSKGLPGKNIKQFNGKPLIAYTIEEALNSPYVEEIFVSSDSKDILKESVSYGASPLKRPEELATDEATSEDAIWFHLNNALKEKNYDAVILLQPTSPLRKSSDINSAVELYKKNKSPVYSVTQLDISPFRSFKIENNLLTPLFDKEKKSRRQDEESTFAANGAIYIFDSQEFLENKKLPSENITPYIMDKKRSYDIDDYTDFLMAEFMMKQDDSNE